MLYVGALVAAVVSEAGRLGLVAVKTFWSQYHGINPPDYTGYARVEVGGRYKS